MKPATRGLIRLLLLLLALAAPTGCRKDRSEEKSAGDAAPPPVEDAAVRDGDANAGPGTPLVTLLDPGREPRQLLRYRPPVGKNDRVALTLKIHSRVRGAGVPDAPIKLPGIVFELKVGANEKQGDKTAYYFEFASARLIEEAGVDPTLLQATRQDVEQVIGVTGTALIDDRGFEEELHLVPPPGMSAQMRQILLDTKQSLNQMSPLPLEPVGVGARWELKAQTVTNGITVNQTVIYELLELSGTSGRLRASITNTAKPQPASLPGLPPGVTASLKSLRGTGGGEVAFQLDRLIPETAGIAMESASHFLLSMDGTERTMQIEAKTALELEHL